jgi:hypothetical protein
MALKVQWAVDAGTKCTSLIFYMYRIVFKYSEKASVLCKQMFAIYHEDLVVQGHI